MDINFKKVLTRPDELVPGTIYFIDDEKSIVISGINGIYEYDNSPKIEEEIKKLIGNTEEEVTLSDLLEKINQLIANKVDKEDGKSLSTNDYTDEDKEKTLILGPHIGNDTEEHQDNLSKAIASNACYGRVTVNGNDGTYISIGKFIDKHVDVLTHRAGIHNSAPDLARYTVREDGIWIRDYSISIEEILTSSNLATQSEIDALFDNGTSGGGSTSY